MLDDNEIRESLCIYDPLNPNFTSWEIEDGEVDDRPGPRGEGTDSCCWCDNCFYRRDQLATEILRLRKELT
jgi:hypothetical protein